jgi:hypothetical protein
MISSNTLSGLCCAKRPNSKPQHGDGKTNTPWPKDEKGGRSALMWKNSTRSNWLNLERETILERLLNRQGEFVRHKTKRIILIVADRFEDRRMQTAYWKIIYIEEIIHQSVDRASRCGILRPDSQEFKRR